MRAATQRCQAQHASETRRRTSADIDIAAPVEIVIFQQQRARANETALSATISRMKRVEGGA